MSAPANTRGGEATAFGLLAAKIERNHARDIRAGHGSLRAPHAIAHQS